MPDIILASASPRRKELLADMGYAFTVEPSVKEEVLRDDLPAAAAVEQLALAKATDIRQRHPQHIVIGCDTVVCLDDQILGKPKDRSDAERMLRMLSGKTHAVISAVAVLYREQQIVFHERSEVTFYELEEDLLQRYLSCEEPYDKAGAYGIQGKGKLLVKRLNGDYFSVMGLPVAKLYRVLQTLLHEKM